MMHPEGKNYFLFTSIAVAGSSLLYLYSSGPLKIVAFILLVLSVVVGIFTLQFFRNPKRPIPKQDDQLIYAPADGKVVVIEQTEEPEYYKDKRIQVSIFMSPINVHANRMPTSGTIEYAEYHKGKYLVAWHPKSSTENERTSIVISNSHGSLLLRQIAGAVARRIRMYVKKGDHLAQGQELGFIKFGSRVDVFLPLDAEILVDKDQTVKGNVDVIAKYSK